MIWDRRLIFSLAIVLAACIPARVWAQDVLERAIFRIKYVAEGAVYLEGGRAAGLKEGQELIVEHFVAPAASAPEYVESSSALRSNRYIARAFSRSVVCSL